MPSQHVLQVNARGLVTAPNPLLVPRDALQVADNVVLERPGFIQSRRGFKRYTYGVGGQTWAVASYVPSAGTGNVVANHGTGSGAVNLKSNNSGDGTGTWTSITGTVTNRPAYGERMQTAQALGKLYLTSGEGVRALSGTTLTMAGLPKCVGLDRYGPANVLTGTGGFLADGYCVAYRAVVGRTSGGAIQLGAPGSRTLVANASGTTGYGAGVARNVVARVLLPKQANTASTALDTSYFVQLYRSGQVANGSTPSDEMQLVFEAYLTATNISNGYVDVTDSQPDALRGAYLYTNPNTGEEGVRVGVLNSNEPPPNAWDVAAWRDCVWYADRSRDAEAAGRYRLLVQLLGAGSTGLAAGQTFTITSSAGAALQTYTAIAPGTPTSGQFVVETSGTASSIIEATATNLVAAINKNTSNTLVYAYYVSGSAPDAPGKILLEARAPIASTANSFGAVVSANGSAWAPSLGTFQLSTADGASNRLYFSKPGQPEAVPAVNFLEVGPRGTNILRLVPVANQLYVLTDGGLYRILGTDWTNWQVDPVDLTCVCAAPQSAVTLDGSLYFLTSQGAVEVTDGATKYISGDIDSDLRAALQALLYDASTGTRPLFNYGFAVAHLLDHRVLFWLPASTTATACSYAYVYDRRAQSWTRWWRGSSSLATAQTFSCGCYSQSGPTAVGLTLGGNATADGWCFVERRALTVSDYQDSLDDDTKVAVRRTVTWAWQDGGDASIAKQWREVQFLFGESRPEAPTVTLATEVQDSTGTPETASVTTTYYVPVSNKMHRLPVGRACGRAARLAVTLASAESGVGFDVAAMALHFRPYSSRVSRGP